MTTNVIAIDGPSYVGKSTIARSLAECTSYDYINTGHMYRAVAFKCREKSVDPKKTSAVVDLAGRLAIDFEKIRGESRTMVDRKDLTDELEDHEIVLLASKIASIPELRAILTDKQRGYAEKRTIIMEGRDIGSIVFPDAVWKFFITASVEVRARRMYKVMSPEEKGRFGDYLKLIPKIHELDEADMNRKIAPLKMADDAIIYDNSDSPSEKQDALILQYYINHDQEMIRNSELLKKRT